MTLTWRQVYAAIMMRQGETAATTWTGTYASGWRATVRAESLAEARRHLDVTGRSERCQVTAGGTYAVWGRDADDDYTEGE